MRPEALYYRLCARCPRWATDCADVFLGAATAVLVAYGFDFLAFVARHP